MYLYSLKFFILIEIIIFIFRENKYINKFLYILLAVYLGARRIEVGTDTITYVHEYITGTGGYFKEYLFQYIGFYLYTLKFSSTLYLIAISLINTLFYYIGFKKLIKMEEKFNNIFWIFLFNITYLYGSINILRQSLATGLLIISIAYLKERKKINALFVWLLSLGFHYTTILFLPLYFLESFYKKINKKWKILFLLLVVIFSYIIKTTLLLNSEFARYFLFNLNVKTFYIKLLLTIVLFLIYIINKRNKRYDILEYVTFYLLGMMLLFFTIPSVSSRLIYYCMPFITILFYNIFYKKKVKKIFILIIFLYHLFVLFYPSTVIMFKWVDY